MLRTSALHPSGFQTSAPEVRGAALVGVLLAGFSGQASLGMGDDYLLPSIAVVVVGGRPALRVSGMHSRSGWRAHSTWATSHRSSVA